MLAKLLIVVYNVKLGKNLKSVFREYYGKRTNFWYFIGVNIKNIDFFTAGKGIVMTYCLRNDELSPTVA